MDSPGYIILSRLTLQSRATQVLAHNVANADTPGFRALRPVFADFVARQDAGGPPPGGRQTHFVQDRATWREMQTGPMQATGNPLDLALTGDGFFAVETPRGERFTRAGRFTIAITSGRVAASVSIRKMVLRRAVTSVRDSDIKVPTIPANSSASMTSGSCSANSVGRYDHGMSGTETSAPSNISFQGFSKKCEK